MTMRTSLQLSVATALTCVLLAPTITSAQTPDFSGFYLGAVGGTGTGSLTSDANKDIDHRPSGGLFGVKAGFNRVVNTLLIGIEADIAATTIDGDDSVTLSGFTSDLTHDLKMLSTVRARIGGIVGNAAVYGTGGFATARVDGVLVVTASGAEVGRNTFKSTHMGWTYGAGIDVSINERVSLTADYLWVDFKPEEVALTIGGFTMTDRGDLNTHTVRVGLNVRF